MRILYISHGHPSESLGGGELAAWRLFQHFSQHLGNSSCGFLAASRRKYQFLPGCQIHGLTEREWLIRPSSNNLIHDTAVSLRNDSPLSYSLQSLRPQLIHAHHYLHVGLDLLYALKSWFPDALMLLTLHEYWGICPFEGRLLRRSGETCPAPDVAQCNKCLGGDHEAQLAVRSRRIRYFFSLIDHFISPSLFLKKRYLDWGVAPKKISVLENMPPPHVVNDTKLPLPIEERSFVIGLERPIPVMTCGYFGQASPWKGLDVILQAILIAKTRDVHLRFQIHGLDTDYLDKLCIDSKYSSFWLHCRQLIAALGAQYVQVCGTYTQATQPSRLAELDCVLMASIWYENSPMVIQEAFASGRPVIAPRLGGMAEKVQHAQNGLLFQPGNPADLAKTLMRLSKNPDLLKSLSAGALISSQRSLRSALQHEKIYRALLPLK